MNSTQFLEQMRAYAKSFAYELRAKTAIAENINAFLDQNYSVYLDSTPEDCEKIRASFYGNRNIENHLFDYTRRAVAQLQATGEEIWLWRGLVSTSLENCGIDFRDTLIGLAELFVTAEQHGITPQAAFQKVAKLSSHGRPRGGKTPVSEMMMNFESYAILKERRERKTGYWNQIATG